MINLYKELINYIEDNKKNYNISYESTIEYLEQLVRDIKKEYEELKEEVQ